MPEYLRGRRALLVDGDGSGRADCRAALTTYGFDLFENWCARSNIWMCRGPCR